METSAGAIYHVARDGQVIGAFSFPTLAAKFKDGSVKASDHYLVEGTSDWKLVGELKPQFAEHERQLKAEADRKAAEAKAAKEAAEAEAAKAKALEIEAEWKRRELVVNEAARVRAEQSKLKPWKCHSCEGIFQSTNTARAYPDASGLGLAMLLFITGSFFAWLTIGAMISRSSDSRVASLICGLISSAATVAAIGFLIAYGVERGLQQFNSYRPRCPNCSSPYCSKQGE